MIHVEWTPAGPLVHEGGNSYSPERVVLHMVAGNSGPVAEWRDPSGRSRSVAVALGAPTITTVSAGIPLDAAEGLARRR